MKLASVIAASTGLFFLSTAHEHENTAGTQEPFIGWTREDLDAKWGTDVFPVISFTHVSY